MKLPPPEDTALVERKPGGRGEIHLEEPQRRRSKPVVHLPRSATSASPERRAGLGGRAPLPLDSDALYEGEFDKRGAVPYASAVVSSNNALAEALIQQQVSLLEGELLRDVSIGKNFDATAIQEQLDHFEKQLRAALAQKRTGEGMRDVRQKEAEEQQRWRLQHLQSRPQADDREIRMVGSALPGDLNAVNDLSDFQRHRKRRTPRSPESAASDFQRHRELRRQQSNRTTDEKQIQRLPTAQAAGEANVVSRLPTSSNSPGQRGQRSPEAPEAESRLPSFAGQDLAGPPSYANGELLQGQRGQRSPEAPEAESRLPSFAGQDLAGGATGCLGLGSTGAKAKELVAPDDSVDTAPRRPRRELLCFEEEGLLEGISQLKSDTVRRQDLLTKGTEELARLKLLISLGTDRRRCHRCDLAICSLRSLLSCLVQVCEATEVNEGDADLLAEMAKILASVAHVDAQLAEMALWLGEVFTQ